MSGALIAAAVALAVFWGTAFVGEDYRRWRDGKALACALAGELTSLRLALELGDQAVVSQIQRLQAGHSIIPREFPQRLKTVYEANLTRIGLLGMEIGRELPYAYHMIINFHVVLTTAMASSDPIQQRAGLAASHQLIGNANEVLPRLLVALETRATSSWRPFRN